MVSIYDRPHRINAMQDSREVTSATCHKDRWCVVETCCCKVACGKMWDACGRRGWMSVPVISPDIETGEQSFHALENVRLMALHVHLEHLNVRLQRNHVSQAHAWSETTVCRHEDGMCCGGQAAVTCSV